jgi:hypothetical protein
MWVYGVGIKVPVPAPIPMLVPEMRVFTLPIVGIFCGYSLDMGKLSSLCLKGCQKDHRALLLLFVII